MPFTINGIGTWYYGKRRMYTNSGTCEFCNRTTDLQSYDTTLFLVVVFIPIVPLGSKRILNQCASCRKHRVLSLSQWESARQRDYADLEEQLQSKPNDRAVILRGVGLAIAYQDEPGFDRAVEAAQDKHLRDAGVQAALGDGHAFFARWPGAEQAYHASLAVDDNDVIREQLAWVMLKQGRPDDARPYLEHILDHKKTESGWLFYYLIAGYQAQGRHEEALQVMDEFEQALPQLAAAKEYQQQRKTSLRHGPSGKKIPSAMLAPAAPGYRQGNWTSRLPRWIAAFIALGCLVAYFGSAIWIGQSRQVYLINGTSKPYSVVVDGTRHKLAANSAKAIRIPEGEVQVDFADIRPALQPLRVQVHSSFWTRPFAGHTFIINPDRSAIVLEEETYYAANPRRAGPPGVLFGRAFYEMTGIDYEFQSFPPSIQVNKHAEVRKKRVALATNLPAETRLGLLQKLDPKEQINICQDLLAIDPGNSIFLYYLSSRLTPDNAIQYVEARLDEQPILVEWHRVYQTLMERHYPEKDVRERYRKLLAENQGTAELLYLLGRADPDFEEGEKLIRQAATVKPPSGHAFGSLGFRALCEAQFAEASAWYEKALPLLTEKSLFEQFYQDALLANGDYDKLLQLLQLNAQVPERQATASVQIMRIHAIRGDLAQARQQLGPTLALYPSRERDKVQKALESILCWSTGDAEGFLKTVGDTQSFEAYFLRGQLQQAAGQVPTDGQDAAALRGLLYLEATRSGDKELAKVHWQGLLDELHKGGHDQKRFGDMLAADKAPDARLVQRIPVDPPIKRVLLAVLAQRFPDQANEALTLARRLNYQHDAVSLCLARFLIKQP
jgi:tetratricopeptide (TPR) repeat protein